MRCINCSNIYYKGLPLAFYLYCRYDTALAINTFGAKHVAGFATRCVNIKMLLHVSTGE